MKHKNQWKQSQRLYKYQRQFKRKIRPKKIFICIREKEINKKINNKTYKWPLNIWKIITQTVKDEVQMYKMRYHFPHTTFKKSERDKVEVC